MPSDHEALAALSSLDPTLDVFLERMLRAYSPTGAIQPVLDYLLGALPHWGIQPKIDGVGNLVATIGDGPVQVAMVGHVDTVPGEVPVHREQDKIFGRGAVDAKGPFASFCASAAAAVAVEPNLQVHLIGCKDEEG